MTYREELSKIIKGSGLSLRDIASRCQSLGVSISHSYISQLQRGKLPPPKEEVSLAICRACGSQPDNLIIYGYFEKTPELIKQYIISCNKVNLKLSILLQKAYPNLADDINVEDMELIERLNFSISKGWKLQSHLEGSENISQYALETNLPNTQDSFFMKDTSMQPLIPKDSLLIIKSYKEKISKKKIIEHEPANGDIILFSQNNEFDLVRRYQKIDNTILLKPENNKYDIIQINNIDEIVILGKITSFISSVE